MNDFDSLFEAYYVKFGAWFPTMCFMSSSDEELMEKMKACLNFGKSAEELYDISNDNDINY